LLLEEIAHPVLQNFPILFLPFRDPYQKLGLEFSLVLIILFCYSTQEIFKIKIIKKYKLLKVASSLIIIFPVVYWAAPFVSGNFIPTEVKADEIHTFSAFTHVPYKYMPVINYLKQDKDVTSGNVRVLVYPPKEVLWCDLKGYWGNDILRFSGISTVSTFSGINFINETSFLLKLYNVSFLEDSDYVNAIAKMGIKYILIQRQPCQVDYGNLTKNQEENKDKDLLIASKFIEEKIDNMPFKKIMKSEYYSLFEISGRSPGSVSLVKESSFDPIIIKKMNFLNSTNLSDNLLQQSVKPQYQKVSSTEYMINTGNITKPFYIVLAESYDEGWKAHINGKEQIPDKYHFTVSDFANGWYINKTGYFNIKLFYQPQKYYEIGLTIYALILCSCLFYSLYNWRKKIIHFIKGLLGRKIKNY
jgi:hypothetical protein